MTSPDGARPDTAQIGSTLGPYYQNADNSSIGRGKNSEMNALLQLMQNNFFTKVLGGFLSVVGAVSDGITAVVEAITGTPGGTLGDLDLWSSGMADELSDHQDSLQVLEGVRARGVAYIPSSLDESFTSSFKRARFNSTTGPVINMMHDRAGSFILLSRGAYEASVRMQFSWVTLTDRRIWCDIVVFDHNNVEFHRAPFVTKTTDVTWVGPVPSNDNYQTICHITNFTVPAAGYRVEVQAKAASTRGILTGYGLTEFTVNKWSSETS